MKRSFNKNPWLLGMFLYIPAIPGMGQDVRHQVTGTLVSDTQGNRMAYAKVLVSDVSNNTVVSTLADEKGSFSFELEEGTYVLRYYELGEVLKQDTINLKGNQNMGLVTVPIANKKLQEVTVVGKKKIITFDKDRLVYSVKNSPYANGFSARDVINNVPGINPSKSEEVSMIGKDGIIVLINGHMSYLKGKDLVNYLNSIPSENLDKIEVVSNPSSEFNASGNTGVLNIILKNRMNLGFDGSLSAGYIQRRKTSFENGGNLSFSNNWLMMEYSIGYWKEKRMHDVRNSFDYIDYSKLIDNESCQKSDYVSQNLNVNIFLNDRMNLGFMSSFNYMDENIVSGVFQEYSGNRSDFSSSNTNSEIKYKGFSFSPYYEWNIDSLGKKLTINYCYNLTSDKSNSEYLSDYELDVVNSLYDNKHFVNTCNLNLTLPFSWLNFELGGEYSHYHADNYASYNIVDKFLYKETVSSFYTDINKSWAKMFFKLGIRYEHTKSEGCPSGVSNNFSKGYANWFPFVEISYRRGGNNTFYLGYSKRVNRPDMSQLNPTRSYTDAYTYTAGNPFLTPSLMDYVELRYQYKKLYVGVSYIHTSDGIGLFLNDNGNSQVEQTYGNCISTNSLVGNVNYNYSHNRFNAAIQLCVNYNKSKSSDKPLDAGSLEGINSFVSGNFSYTVGSKALVYARYLYYFAGQEQYVHYKSFQNFSMGVNCILVKQKLILNASINDLFGTYYNRNQVVYDNFVFNNRNDYDNRCLNVKLTYKFGNHKVKRSHVDINSVNNRLSSPKR